MLRKAPGPAAHLEAGLIIEAPMATLIDLLSYRPLDWLEAFLRLSAYEADSMAGLLARRVGRNPPRTKSLHVRATLFGAEAFGEGRTRFRVRWNVAEEGCVLGSFAGHFRLAPTSDGALLGIRGIFSPPLMRSSDPTDAEIAVQAALAALRSLLGNLKSAVEEHAKV